MWGGHTFITANIKRLDDNFSGFHPLLQSCVKARCLPWFLLPTCIIVGKLALQGNSPASVSRLPVEVLGLQM